jgi:hypothetical protein
MGMGGMSGPWQSQGSTATPGLMGATNQGTPASVVGGQGAINNPTAAPVVPSGPPNFQSPVPGMSGITPGAIERRLSGPMNVPPTAQMNPAAGMPPAQQMQLGNTMGADPRAVLDPVAMIREFLMRGRQ